LIYCAIVIAYITFMGADTVLNQSIAYALIGLAATVIAGYCGFAVVEDNNIRNSQALMPRGEEIDNPDED
jgi:uncharacterized membrane protein YuzA (DUF378 family)